MLAALLVPLLIAADGGGTEPVASHALDGCEATRIGAEGWEYACLDGKANSVDDARQIDPGAYFVGRRAASQAAVGHAVEFTRERRRLGGREAEVLTGGGGGDVSVLVPFPEGTRMLDCVSRRAEWCRSALDALAARPWRAGAATGSVAAEERPLRVGDYVPNVPTGCRARPTASGGQIACPGGFLAAWGSMPDDATASRALGELSEKVVGGVMRALPESLRAEAVPKEMPCRIAGVAATCTSITVDGGSRRFVGMWGQVALKGVSTIAFCTSDGRGAIPSPCSTVFEAR